VESLDSLIAQLRDAPFAQREAIKAQLVEAAGAVGDHTRAIDHLEAAKKELPSLELRWEVDEVIEAITPPPEPEPEAEAEAEEPADPNAPLSQADLDLVYDDPRGLLLHKAKKADRWFATQRNPQTGQPQTFELHPQEVAQLKQQLAGSPYWVLGAGGAA
jgi:hypothetical protein